VNSAAAEREEDVEAAPQNDVEEESLILIVPSKRKKMSSLYTLSFRRTNTSKQLNEEQSCDSPYVLSRAPRWLRRGQRMGSDALLLCP